jgi:hypothetical protein
MLSFLFQTLFALQGTTKRNTSYSLNHVSGVHLPSPPFIIVEPKQQFALFASPSLNDDIIYQSERLDWLQERLGLNNEQSIELARRFPKVHSLSIEEQLEPTLDWLQTYARLAAKKD